MRFVLRKRKFLGNVSSFQPLMTTSRNAISQWNSWQRCHFRVSATFTQNNILPCVVFETMISYGLRKMICSAPRVIERRTQYSKFPIRRMRFHHFFWLLEQGEHVETYDVSERSVVFFLYAEWNFNKIKVKKNTNYVKIKNLQRTMKYSLLFKEDNGDKGLIRNFKETIRIFLVKRFLASMWKKWIIYLNA